MGKRAPDDVCRNNFVRLRSLFDSVVPDHARFQMVYACGVEARMSYTLVTRTTAYTYASYAVGFDVAANEIVIVPVPPDLSSHGKPVYLAHNEITSARQSFVTKEITIKDKRLPRKYVQLIVQDCINEDPDGVCLLVKQDDEAKRFLEFFKQTYKT